MGRSVGKFFSFLASCPAVMLVTASTPTSELNASTKRALFPRRSGDRGVRKPRLGELHAPLGFHPVHTRMPPRPYWSRSALTAHLGRLTEGVLKPRGGLRTSPRQTYIQSGREVERGIFGPRSARKRHSRSCGRKRSTTHFLLTEFGLRRHSN